MLKAMPAHCHQYKLTLDSSENRNISIWPQYIVKWIMNILYQMSIWETPAELISSKSKR